MSDSIEGKSGKIVCCNLCKVDGDARIYDNQTGYLNITFRSKHCTICGEFFYLCSICESLDSPKTIQVIKKRSYYYRDVSPKDWRLKYLCSENCRQVWDVAPKGEIVNER